MGVLTALAVLAAIGLVFAMDPGGTIAESSFPDFHEMGWKQLAVWGFRTIGVVLGQLLIIALWLWPKHRHPQASTWYSGIPQPGSMPAAAVSTLQGHAVGSRTLLASIIEMCQRGALRIEAAGTRAGFVYQLSRQGLTEYEWERTICDSMPTRATTVDALRDAMREHEDAVGDQIGGYLRHRGLFDDSPVRVRRTKSDDGSDWWMLACILTGAGAGLWAALWLDQWWANALIGAGAGLLYSFVTVPSGIRTGMLKPTPAGAVEISQWLGWKASMAGPALPGARSQSDPMLAYAVAFDIAEPWLDVAASAPPWFGSRGESSLRGADLDAAYRAFMHAPDWYLAGRSEDAAKAAAQSGYEEEIQLLEQLEQLDAESPDTESAARQATFEAVESVVCEPELRREPPAAPAEPPPAEHQLYRREEPVAEQKSGGCLCGCVKWAVRLAGVGAVVMVVLFSLDVVSPREKPCPLDSPPIPTPAQIVVLADLFHDQCVRVRGTVVSQDGDRLVMEMDRGEYVQRVDVLDPSEALAGISRDRVVNLAGRLKVEEDGTYAVHFVPDRGSDRGWWRNLRENLEGLF